MVLNRQALEAFEFMYSLKTKEEIIQSGLPRRSREETTERFLTTPQQVADCPGNCIYGKIILLPAGNSKYIDIKCNSYNFEDLDLVRMAVALLGNDSLEEYLDGHDIEYSYDGFDDDGDNEDLDSLEMDSRADMAKFVFCLLRDFLKHCPLNEACIEEGEIWV